MKTSFMRKVQSRVAEYGHDFRLQSLIYDASLAKSLKAKLTIAEGKDTAPETLTDSNHMFDSYWLWAADVLYDRCRVNGRPNCWITISPGEWLFPKHSGLFGRCTQHKDLSHMQGLLTLHLYHVLEEVLREVFGDTSLFAEVLDYVIRVEFQGRGTLHVHIPAWVKFPMHVNTIAERHPYSDRNHCDRYNEDSPLLRRLSELFNARVDVMCDSAGLDSELFKYITGYAAKGSDAMQWKSNEYGKRLFHELQLHSYRPYIHIVYI